MGGSFGEPMRATPRKPPSDMELELLPSFRNIVARNLHVTIRRRGASLGRFYAGLSEMRTRLDLIGEVSCFGIE